MGYRVAIARLHSPGYPSTPPYHPPRPYPELPYVGPLDPSNRVYDTFRTALHQLRLDPERHGSPDWNPLAELVRPGDSVFIKPNMIAHKHAHNEDWEYVITHGSVVRALLDYVWIALGGRGHIIIGDAPQTDSDFDEIVRRMGLPEIIRFYASVHGPEITLLDLRDERWIEQEGIYVRTEKLPGDPRGSVEIDLASMSMFASLDGTGRKYYGAFYRTTETNEHHRSGRHEYSISRSSLEAAVFINVPKLKCHKKCGLTANLKSLVGINANKNWLPHYAFGSPARGGDQFPEASLKRGLENVLVLAAKRYLARDSALMKFAARKLKRPAYALFGSTDGVIRSGNWYGNDTVWRMCLDLNRILLYGDPDGALRPDSPPKRFFSIVDGILAMEGNGPVAGSVKPAGALIAGSNPVSVDAVCARLMGFDYLKLPLLARSFDPHPFPLISDSYESIETVSNEASWNGPLHDWPPAASLHFRPHFGWVNRIELAG